MSTLRLFGTDGIRGEVAKSEDDNLSSLNTLCDKRLITPMVMAIVGYSCGSILKRETWKYIKERNVEISIHA